MSCPSKRGQSRNARPAPLPTTYEPVSMSAKVAIAAKSARFLKEADSRVCRITGRAGIQTDIARNISSASTADASARWAMTRFADKSLSTVIPPRTAWAITNTSASTDPHLIVGLLRIVRQATITKARTRKPTTDASSRCENSIITADSNGGISSPRQRGQSGQASPDSVALTMPPSTISEYVAKTVERISQRKPLPLPCATFSSGSKSNHPRL